jgi:hypothetical protein
MPFVPISLITRVKLVGASGVVEFDDVRVMDRQHSFHGADESLRLFFLAREFRVEHFERDAKFFGRLLGVEQDSDLGFRWASFPARAR